ncbi:MAG: signal peptidase I [Armatimonadota bacterium]|nr:signal peptidase I [Armatimonadota bacterium]MDR7411376.1 signal peptidase I [Armatimonadota bacterium]
MRGTAFPMSLSEPSIPVVILAVAAGLLAARTVIRRAYLFSPAVRRMVLETVDAALFAVILAFVIITFVVQAFYIPSGSMEPTLRVGDRILVAKFYYRLAPIQRGDVIVFRYPLNPGKDFVKRVVGLPGDTVQLRSGVVVVNGKARPDLTPSQGDSSCPQNYGPKKVDAGHLFVMGDNRCNSEDSRFFGLVPVRNVVGKAVVVYWPPHRVGLVH